MLVLSVLLGLVAWKTNRARNQREIVAWVHELGGTVTYETRGPQWLRNWLGRDFFDDVAEVHLRRNVVSDLSPLANLTKLVWLDLALTQVSDVTPLAKLTKLEELDLEDTQVSEQAMDQLKRALPQCRIID